MTESDNEFDEFGAVTGDDRGGAPESPASAEDVAGTTDAGEGPAVEPPNPN